MWLRKVRKADIEDAHRDIFERFGENVIASVLASGFTPAHPDLVSVYKSEVLKEAAAKWLTERGDAGQRHEQRVEALEWAVLLFVIAGSTVETINLVRSLCGNASH